MASLSGNIMGWKLIFVLWLCCIQFSLGDLICRGGGGGACDWACRLTGRKGECRLDTERNLLNCSCFGDVMTGLDLFADHNDGDNTVDDHEDGSLPTILPQADHLPATLPVIHLPFPGKTSASCKVWAGKC